MDKRKLPKRAVIRGRRYRLIWRKPRRRKDASYDGFCDHPNCKEPVIQINATQDPLMILDTVMHETLHACNPDADERAIVETMNSIIPLLMRMGIRVSFEPGKPCGHQWFPAAV